MPISKHEVERRSKPQISISEHFRRIDAMLLRGQRHYYIEEEIPKSSVDLIIDEYRNVGWKPRVSNDYVDETCIVFK